MPEIPEMEIYKNYLNKFVAGKRILKGYVHRAKCLNLEPLDFLKLIEGRTVKQVNRRGKFLVFELDSEKYLLAHMMLDGRLYYIPLEYMNETLNLDNAETLKREIQDLPSKPSVIFKLEDASLLFFCSLTFGYLHYLDKIELDQVLGKLGIDPLADNLTKEAFKVLLKGKRGMVKPWLMEQRNLAGVGNAYSNESLFEAGILPKRQISSLSDLDRDKLLNALYFTLQESLKLGGDMEEPFAPWDKFTGGFIPYFKVYDREGEPCRACGEIIKKEEVGGRNAFFCSNCQK